MAVRKYKPSTPGRRGASASDFGEVTRRSPEKSLTRASPKRAGRNAYGRITARHQGGGHKRQYRVIDFRRDKDGVPAKVATVEYDPNRTARIALLHYSGADVRPGNALPLASIPVGTLVHAVELKPGAGAKMARSAGVGVQVLAKEAGSATLRMPSGEIRMVDARCRATVGEVGNAERELVSLGKAGRNRWLGIRPSVRGVAMNPVDHPLGGGEGKSSGGRNPTSPGGKTEGRTRKPKPSDKL